MFKKVIAIAAMVSTCSAFAVSQQLKDYFVILNEDTPQASQLRVLIADGLKRPDGTNIDVGLKQDPIAQQFVRALRFISSKDNVWTEANSNLCFETGMGTYEYNMCSSTHLMYVQGTAYRKYDIVRTNIRNSDLYAANLGKDLVVDFLQNMSRAKGKIVSDLCEADTIGWWGGTGRTAGILGCHSNFLKDLSDFDMLDAFSKYTTALQTADDDDERLQINETTTSTVERKRRSIMMEVDNNSTSYDEDMLKESDAKLNAEYRATNAYYESAYKDAEDWAGGLEEKTIVEYAKEMLKTFQRAWIQYRNAYCQAYSVMLFPEVVLHKKYGAFARVQCLRTMTEKQIKVLKNLDERGYQK